MIKFLVYSLLVFAFACCPRTVQNVNTSDTPSYISVAEKILGDSPRYLLNETQTHVICYILEKTNIQNPQGLLHYIIYDIKNEVVLREEDLDNGKIRWLDHARIEVSSTPGMVRKESNEGMNIRILDINQLKQH